MASGWEYDGAGEGNRTRDLRITSAPLYQLSYAGPLTLRKCYVISSACVCQSTSLRRVRVGIVGNDSEPITGFGSSVSEARVAACRGADCSQSPFGLTRFWLILLVLWPVF